MLHSINDGLGLAQFFARRVKCYRGKPGVTGADITVPYAIALGLTRGVVLHSVKRARVQSEANPCEEMKMAGKSKLDETFSEDEREAMRERAKESKRGKADGEADLLAKIAEMTEPDKGMAEAIHALVKAAAPELECKTWYGMPAYAKGGKVICFFQSAAKFKARYATLGFSENARLDDGNMWASSFALMKLTAAEEARITALVKLAVG